MCSLFFFVCFEASHYFNRQQQKDSSIISRQDTYVWNNNYFFFRIRIEKRVVLSRVCRSLKLTEMLSLLCKFLLREKAKVFFSLFFSMEERRNCTSNCDVFWFEIIINTRGRTSNGFRFNKPFEINYELRICQDQRKKKREVTIYTGSVCPSNSINNYHWYEKHKLTLLLFLTFYLFRWESDKTHFL